MNGPDGSVAAQADVPGVLLVARELDLGGSERQLAVTALGLDRALFQPHAACFRAGGFRARELKRAGVPVLELGVRSLVSLSALDGARRLGRYLRRHRIQVVHAFDVPSVLFAVPVARWYRVPVVLSSQRAHRALTPGLTRHLLRLTDRLAEGIVVNSQAVARELVAEDGVPRSLLHLAYNGIDTDRFRPAGPREQSEEHPRGQPEGNSGALGDRLLPGPMPSGAGEQPEGNSGILGDRRPPGPVPSGTEGHSRAALPWSEPRLVIGVACALRPEKGLFTLLDAFARMRERYPQARLLIVGSGPMGGQLEERARRLGIGSVCHFQPAVEEVAPWLRAMDIFVLPSLSEALSNALMEAMACGCCAVASEVGGNPELVKHGETGWLFPAGDSLALAAALESLLDNQALRHRLAEAGAGFIREGFSSQAAARRMGRIYAGCIGGAGGSASGSVSMK